MGIRRWHSGKLVILWAWGGILVVLLMTNFLSAPAEKTPYDASSLSFATSLAILLGLTVITWVWLGGKEK